MRVLSTRTMINELLYKNKGKSGSLAQEEMQIRLIRTRSRANDVVKHKNSD